MNDPWITLPPSQHPQAPIGSYVAVFVGVSDVKFHNGDSKWRFSWKVKAGAEAGKEASALTDQSISPSTLAGRLVSGLLGKPLVAGEHVKSAVDQCVGKTYLVTVAPGPRGGKPCVRSCSPPPAM